MSGWDFESY
jgi:hypothetical protein